MTGQRQRANPIRVFWYWGWCWSCWQDCERRSVPHDNGHGFATPGEAADSARRHFAAAHPAELIIRLAMKGARS